MKPKIYTTLRIDAVTELRMPISHADAVEGLIECERDAIAAGDYETAKLARKQLKELTA